MGVLILMTLLSIVCLAIAEVLEVRRKHNNASKYGKYVAISEWMYLKGYILNYIIMLLIPCIVDCSSFTEISDYIFASGGWWTCGLLCMIGYLPGIWIYRRWIDPLFRRNYLEKYLIEQGILNREVSKIRKVLSLCKQSKYIPLAGGGYAEIIGDYFQIETTFYCITMTCLLDSYRDNIYCDIDSSCELSNYADISYWRNEEEGYVVYYLCVRIFVAEEIEADIYKEILESHLNIKENRLYL